MSGREEPASAAASPDHLKWLIYDNNMQPLPGDFDWKSVPAPPWRTFGGVPEPTEVTRLVDARRHHPAKGPGSAGPRVERVERVIFEPNDPTWQDRDTKRAYYEADADVLNAVNLALRLRRPILVTGPPGTGKTTLAYSIAYRLGLGPVLEWLITSRSTLRDGLYQYDVLARINDMNLANKATDDLATELETKAKNIGRYITLGPLGDALLPRPRPRVLLIDEIDKCDIDLPGDLLHVFDRGSYEIPELVRETDNPYVPVSRANADIDEEKHVWIGHGQVRCAEFPLIVLTSNEERDFSPAFERRCLRIELKPPTPKRLEKIAINRLELPEGSLDAAARRMIEEFASKDVEVGIGPEGRTRAISQLLNALYLRLKVNGLKEEDLKKLDKIVLARLSE